MSISSLYPLSFVFFFFARKKGGKGDRREGREGRMKRVKPGKGRGSVNKGEGEKEYTMGMMDKSPRIVQDNTTTRMKELEAGIEIGDTAIYAH